MAPVKLELRCPRSVDGISVDPEPDWTFDDLLAELNSLEKKLSASAGVLVPFTKTSPRGFPSGRSVERNNWTPAMRVIADEFEVSGIDNEEFPRQSSVARRHLCCDKRCKRCFFNGKSLERKEGPFVMRLLEDELYLSDDDDSINQPSVETETWLMEEVGLAEAALFELTHEHQQGVKEEIRNQISMLEIDIKNAAEKSVSAFQKIEKYREARQENDRKFDTQYQRKIAEALDNHLTVVQRDHELKSQIEERKIRSDAAYEEAKRKEKALLEERQRQEKAKAEAEAKLREEESRRAAAEAERRAKEAADREAAKTKQVDTGEGIKGTTDQGITRLISSAQPAGTASDKLKILQSSGKLVKAAESALILEQERLRKLNELEERNQALKLSTDFSSFERHIARSIRQTSGTKENVRTKADELVKLLSNTLCPQSISIAAFAKKIVSSCERPDCAAFACGHVIVLVTSKVPHAMDILLAEFHRACIYIVPKHLLYSESAFESNEAYFKAIGYREDEGKIESTKDYLKRLESYMKLYAALIQTEVEGVENAHGLKEGWAWLARLLNTLPANLYTAVALKAFLQTAGYAMFRKYKAQFKKVMKFISDRFLAVLKTREEQGLKQIIAEIQSYLDDRKFLQKPEGSTLPISLLSNVMVPDRENQEPSYGYGHSSRGYFY